MNNGDYMDIYKILAAVGTSLGFAAWSANDWLTMFVLISTIWYTIVRTIGVLLDNKRKRKELDGD